MKTIRRLYISNYFIAKIIIPYAINFFYVSVSFMYQINPAVGKRTESLLYKIFTNLLTVKVEPFHTFIYRSIYSFECRRQRGFSKTEISHKTIPKTKKNNHRIDYLSNRIRVLIQRNNSFFYYRQSSDCGLQIVYTDDWLMASSIVFTEALLIEFRCQYRNIQSLPWRENSFAWMEIVFELATSRMDV